MRTSFRLNGWIGSLLIAIPLAATGQERQSLVDAASFRSLAADHRAFRVGDVVMICVLEDTTAKAQAATDTSSGVTIHGTASSSSKNYTGNLGLDGANTSSAQTTRLGELRTQISAQVTAVTPEGLLDIAGTQTLTVNGEQQRISVSGLVRPQDIGSDNTVWSNRIAQAHLELLGAGVVSESQRRSIVYRIFKWLRLM